MAETVLHPPVEVYGEYAMANGFEESNEGTETPLRATPEELDEEPVAAAAAPEDEGVERDAVAW
jgi:hypothetical protein